MLKPIPPALFLQPLPRSVAATDVGHTPIVSADSHVAATGIAVVSVPTTVPVVTIPITTDTRRTAPDAPKATPVAQTAPDMIASTTSTAPSPDQQQLEAMARDLAAVRQTVEQLAAGQEQMARDVAKLQAAEKDIRHRILAPPPQPAAAPARKPAPPPAQPAPQISATPPPPAPQISAAPPPPAPPPPARPPMPVR